MNYSSAKANKFPTQLVASLFPMRSYTKTVGLDGSSYRLPVQKELESLFDDCVIELGYRSLFNQE